METVTETDDGTDEVADAEESAQEVTRASETTSGVLARRRKRSAISNLIFSMNNLPSRSVCAWKYSINNDPLRMPADIPEASCISETVPNTANKCESVLFSVPVKKLVAGFWQDQQQNIKVGCTLASPITNSRTTS